jgi:hypothetical protein
MIISNYWPLLINILSVFQESNDGQSMMDFRRSLPANKERQSLLEAISQNQVLLFSRLFHVTNITSNLVKCFAILTKFCCKCFPTHTHPHPHIHLFFFLAACAFYLNHAHFGHCLLRLDFFGWQVYKNIAKYSVLLQCPNSSICDSK